MKLQQDLREFVELLILEKVEFLIVGGWAYNYYADPRTTGDIDFFVSATPENNVLLRNVLTKFGFGSVLPEGDLIEAGKVMMLGRKPNRIDLLTSIDGVAFEEAWQTRIYGQLDGLTVPLISKELLLKNKLATGRLKDQADAEILNRL